MFHCDPLGPFYQIHAKETKLLILINDRLVTCTITYGFIPAIIFEINHVKAKILIFEVGPKSDLSLHGWEGHATVLTANYDSLYLGSDFIDLFHFNLILIL